MPVEGEEGNCPVRKEVDRFFAKDSFNPLMVLLAQKSEHEWGRDEGYQDKVRAAVGDCLTDWQTNFQTIAKNFNEFEWWHTHGKQAYPLIFPTACTTLPLPDSNGYQERVFSTATWHDSNLKKKQSAATLQMKVCNHKNVEFMKTFDLDLEQDRLNEARKRTKELLEFSESLHKGKLSSEGETDGAGDDSGSGSGSDSDSDSDSDVEEVFYGASNGDEEAAASEQT